MFSIPTDTSINIPVESQEAVIGNQVQAESPVTKTIDINKIDAPVTDKVKIDFFSNENAGVDFISQPSAPSANVISPIGVQNTNSGSTPYINSPQLSGLSITGKTKDDFRSSAKLIVTIIDAILSNGLKFIAKADTNKSFCLDQSQIKLLIDAWVDFLYEKQQRMSPTLGLVLATLSIYAFLIPEAIKMRAEHNKKFGAKKTPEIKPNVPLPTQTESKNLTVVKQAPLENKTSELIFQSPSVSIEKNALGYVVGTHWTNPDPNIVCETRNELQKYLDRGVFPMYIINKINKKKKIVPYSDNGEVKLPGRKIIHA